MKHAVLHSGIITTSSPFPPDLFHRDCSSLLVSGTNNKPYFFICASQIEDSSFTKAWTPIPMFWCLSRGKKFGQYFLEKDISSPSFYKPLNPSLHSLHINHQLFFASTRKSVGLMTLPWRLLLILHMHIIVFKLTLMASTKAVRAYWGQYRGGTGRPCTGVLRRCNSKIQSAFVHLNDHPSTLSLHDVKAR